MIPMKLLKGELQIQNIMVIQTEKKLDKTSRAYILLDESPRKQSITKRLRTLLKD